MSYSEQEARIALAVPKTASPAEWENHQSIANVSTNEFGVLDSTGAVMKGMAVAVRVKERTSPNLVHWVFTLSQQNFGVEDRVYQLDIRKTKGVHINSHGWHHEHFGEEGRYAGPAAWSNLSFDDALRLFLERTNITLDGDLSHPGVFKLKG